MKRSKTFAIPLLLLLSTTLTAQTPHYQSHFPPEEFQARWAKLFDKIGDRAVAIVQGVARGFNFPRQSNEFYYLSGIETPGAYLLLDGRTRKTTLLLPPRASFPTSPPRMSNGMNFTASLASNSLMKPPTWRKWVNTGRIARWRVNRASGSKSSSARAPRRPPTSWSKGRPNV
jgi:hypothetical protein